MSHLPGSPPSPLKTTSQRGIALLITLVILALLAVFMTEFAFETKLETRGIQNYQASFKARNAVKSMFKAVLEGLEGQEEVKFFRVYLKDLLRLGNMSNEISFLNPPQPVRLPAGIIADFPEVSFYTPVIRPIDHLYNLNRIEKNNPETLQDLELRYQFVNILNNITTENGQVSGNNDAFKKNYAALFDWIDEDQNPYPMIGVELYQALVTEIELKNAKLDRLSEILLIDGIIKSGIPFDKRNPEQGSWKKYFTVYPVGLQKGSDLKVKPYINVNLATEREIKEFLLQFVNDSNLNDASQEFIAGANDIALVFSKSVSGAQLSYYNTDLEIQQAMNNRPETLSLRPMAHKFF
nr:hypothetical protein [Pseudomonadota bacterium]